MLSRYNLSFEKGSILTQQMLSAMYNIPNNTIELLLSDITDGIICGMNIDADGETIKVSPGIYKLNGNIYTMTEEYSYKILTDESIEYALVLSECNSQKLEYSIDIETICLNVIKLSEVNPDHTVICIFNEAPKMPQNYKDNLDGNRINLMNAMYASVNEYTYIPYLWNLVFEKIKSKKVKHPLDYSLMNTISLNKVASKEMAREYITEAGNIVPGKDDEIFRCLLSSIDKLKFEVSVLATEFSTQPNSGIKNVQNQPGNSVRLR